MNYYIDIHNHCLPNVDDGAKNKEESLEMLRCTYDQGIRDIIVTPHFKKIKRGRTKEEIQRKLREMQEALDNEKIDLKLHIGCELFYSSRSIEYLENNIIATLADSSYILIEFYPDEEFRKIREATYELLAAGYVPILAHVERYQYLSDLSKVVELIELGALIQVNVASILGKQGRKTTKYVNTLLKNRLVHFVATDAHDMDRRRPRLLECVHYLEKKYGIEYADELCTLNPQKILKKCVE